MPVPTATRRDEVLSSIVDYVFENGVSDLSLRPLAEALGTSGRMLIYHFESKERLLAEVLAAARARQYQMLDSWRKEGASLSELIRRYWEWAAAEPSRPYMRLFFEVFGLAVQGRPGTEGILRSVSEDAVAFFRSAADVSSLAPGEAEPVVRLGIGVLRGLLFDLLATGDRAPLDTALERFLAFLDLQFDSQKE